MPFEIKRVGGERNASQEPASEPLSGQGVRALATVLFGFSARPRIRIRGAPGGGVCLRSTGAVQPSALAGDDGHTGCHADGGNGSPRHRSPISHLPFLLYPPAVRSARLLTVLSAAALLCSARARAAGPLGAKGDPIQTSAYAIDLFQGPVLASSRVTSLGGSYAGIAEGVEGGQLNPAAHAVRVPWSIDWFDYDWTLGFTLPSSLANTDFDNNGTPGFSYDSFRFMTLGANMQTGAWAFGILTDAQTYHLAGMESVDANLPNLRVDLMRARAHIARAWFGGQLVVGAGFRMVTMSFTASKDPMSDQEDDRELFNTTGAAPEVGAIWAPSRLPLRAGITGRLQTRSETDLASETKPNAEGDILLGSMYLPEHVELPWEVEAGFSWQFGKRRLNLPWINPRDVVAPLTAEINRARAARLRARVSEAAERKARALEDDRMRASRADARSRLQARYRAMPRQKLLVSASLLVTGPTSNAVGLESFLRQQVDRSGRRVSFTPRLGVETELVPELLMVRAGTYLEPSRFRAANARLHGTAGFDLRLFAWRVFGLFEEGTAWRAGAFLDATRGYLGWGASVGVWH